MNMDKTNIDNCFQNVREHHLVSSLNKKELDLIGKDVSMVSFMKGDNIVKQGQFITHVLYIYGGHVKIQVEMHDRVFLTDVLGKGSFVSLPLMLSRDEHFFSVVALDDVTMFMIDVDAVKNVMQKNTGFSQQMLEESCRLCCDDKLRLFRFMNNHTHGRVANALLYLHEHVYFERTFNILLSRNEIAYLTGVSRENVIKVLTEFKKDGVLDVEGKKITIKDLAYLKKVASRG